MTQIDDKRFHAAIIQVLDAAEAIKMSLKDQGLSYDAKAKKIISRPRYTFKAGEWVVFVDIDGTKSVLQIKRFIYNTYEFTDGSACDKSAEQFMRPWTIADAGSGDVLFNMVTNVIALYSHIQGDCIKPYCYKSSFGFHIGDSLLYLDGFVPATQAQREELFDTIRAVGYEWDEKDLLLKSGKGRFVIFDSIISSTSD